MSFMQTNLQKAVEVLKQAQKDGSTVQVINHMDCDGLSSGGILASVLERADIEYVQTTVTGIGKNTVEELDNTADLTLFSDIGSGQLNLLHDHFKGNKTLMFDHHHLVGEEWKGLIQINPCMDGLDGGSVICSSGITYKFARAFDENNADLAKMAIVGSVGDIQNFWGEFEGFNIGILKEAEEAGVVKKETDIMFYGRHLRPVFQSLQYFTDPYIPGVSNSESGAVSLLNSLNIPLKVGDKIRTASQLTIEEKQRLTSQLIQKAMAEVPKELEKYIPKLIIGDVYNILGEEDNPELKGASEFSTCMNACGRNDKPEIALKIAKGERGATYKKMEKLLAKHRQNIAKALGHIEGVGMHLGPKNFVQYYNGEDKVPSTIVGTVAGMLLGSELTDPYKPLVGFGHQGEGYKVSARCSRILVLQGIDMAESMTPAAEAVGGSGGGHNVACGAYIPDNKLDKFIELFEKNLLEARKKDKAA